MARLALRKNEVRLLRWKDIDLERGELRVRGKGGHNVDVPIVFEDLRADLAGLALETDAQPGEYLLFPIRWGNAPRKPEPAWHRARAPRPADAALDDAPLV